MSEMATGHHDHAHHHAEHARAAGARALTIALALTGLVFAVELAGGIAADSLALLADAGHLLGDAGSLALALVAVRMAARPASGRHTFGWQRAEILAALANGALLLVIGAVTAWAAVGRLADPPSVEGGLTLLVATVGLVVNLICAAVLSRSGGGLNTRAALGHVLADALASVGVIAAALVILASGWMTIDPLISLAIAGLIVWGGAGIVRAAVDILMEAAPRGLDIAQLGDAIAAVDGVVEVHDLHAWTVTSGFPAVAAHITIGPDVEPWLVRQRTAEMMRRHFGIDHSTLQVEREGDEGRLLQIRGGS